MKVAILSFYSGHWSRGVETWAANLKQRLHKAIQVDIIPGWKSYVPFFWLTSDILVPANGRLQSLLCRIVCWFTGKPLVIFGNSGPGADDKWNLLCSPDVFVVSSSFQAEWAKKFKLPQTLIRLIPHAVDTRKFTPPAPPPKENIVLCVAADTPAKRIGLVRAAVKLLPGVRFVHVGGDPRQAKYHDLPAAYRAARVFCLVPVPWEAFGLVFLEALASNLPVVTIDDPVRREIVGDAGIFVKNPQNASQLAQAIDLALKTDWQNKPTSQAAKFSWDKITRQYYQLFTSL